jgi:formamidase
MTDARRVAVDPTRPLRAQPTVGHNRWHPDVQPVLAVAPGETFTLETIDSSDAFLTAESELADVLRFPLDRVHPLTGPVLIEGTEAGDLLEVEIVDVTPRPPGISAIAPGDGLLGDLLETPCLHVWELDADVARCRAIHGVRIPAAPFPGTIGVAPSREQLEVEHAREAELAARGYPLYEAAPAAAIPARPAGLRTLPPRTNGGNLDIRQLTAGSRLFVEANVDGALLSVGDVHLAQGDGELAATAIEIAASVTLRCHVHRDPVWRPRFPAVLAPARPVGPAFMTTGIPLRDDGALAPDDLMLAARNAALELVGWLQAHCELDFGAAYTLASIAGQLRIAQLVNSPSPTVTLALPLEAFETTPSGIR